VITVRAYLPAVAEQRPLREAGEADVAFMTVQAAGGGWRHRVILSGVRIVDAPR
jgi:hypothetical protein